MDELVKRLRRCAVYLPEKLSKNAELLDVLMKAADAIEELSAKVDRLQIFADNISKLPDCNTCLKKTMCEFRPKYGEYCRINCPAWMPLPELPKEG